MQDIPREFQGVWIPRQIWLNKNLSYLEKCLWAELNSLDHEERGCTASNGYLCKMMGINERPLQTALSNLKKRGFIRYTDFNGRQRTIKTFSCPRDEEIISREVKKSSPQKRRNLHPEILDKILDKNPPPPPPQQQNPKVDSSFLKKEEEEFLKPTKEEREELDRRFKERKSKDPIKVKKNWEQVVLKEMREQRKAADQAVKASFLAETRATRHKMQAEKFDGEILDLPWKKGVIVNASDVGVWFSWKEGGYSGDKAHLVPYHISDAEWEIMTGWKKEN